MNSTKNYSTDGGDTLVIGGKIVLEDGAIAEGFAGGSYTLPAATTEQLGGVKQAESITQLEESAQLPAVVEAMNNLLAKLKAAGIIAAE